MQAPFERLKIYNQPDVALRRAIILQAIIDSTNTSDNKIARRIEKEAKDWLFGDSEYFKKICNEAGFDPEYVVSIAKAMIKLNNASSRKRAAS